MNLPNKLTLVRMFLIPVFVVLFYVEFPFHMYAALAVFIIASLTDFVDGRIARSRNLVTTFGKFMDPLADKLLVLTALALFVEGGRLPAWCFAIIMGRELAVTTLRIVAMDAGRVLAAGWSGKVKTFSTMIGICLMLIPAIYEAAPWSDTLIVLVIVLTTLYSGVEYFIKNRDVFAGEM